MCGALTTRAAASIARLRSQAGFGNDARKQAVTFQTKGLLE